MTPAATQRANAVLSRLPSGSIDGAEIGVWRGHMSAALLQREDLRLHMVDEWRGRNAWVEGYQPKDQHTNMAQALEQTAFAGARRFVWPLPSVEVAQQLQDGALDFAFIDADHSYDAVRADIAAWLPKLKSGALLCGHDYDNPDGDYGKEVRRAVDEAVAANGWTLELGPQTTWFVRLP